MASEAQISANRRNAKLSTGPRSGAGRARSARNACKSGIYAQPETIPGEDPAELDALKSRLYDSLQPTAEEATLVDAVARADWQLRRFSRVEAQIWTDVIATQKNPRAPLRSAYMYQPEFLDRLYRQQASTARTLRHSLDSLLRLRKLDLLQPTGPDEPDSPSVKPEPVAPPLTSSISESTETNPIPEIPSGEAVTEPQVPLSHPAPPAPESAETNPIPETSQPPVPNPQETEPWLQIPDSRVAPVSSPRSPTPPKIRLI